MPGYKSEMRATLLLTLCAACLLSPTAAVTSDGDASSPHDEVQSDMCPSDQVAAVCKACSVDVNQCCNDIQLYSACQEQLDTAATQTKSLAKRSIRQFDDAQLLDMQEQKRRNPFLGKRANPFLGKRRVNPFLGKRRGPAPFLGKRTADDVDGFFTDKRRMPFLG